MDLVGEICLYLDSQPSKDVEFILREYKVSLNFEESALLSEVAAKQTSSQKKWSELLYTERKRVLNLKTAANRISKLNCLQFMQLAAYKRLDQRNYEIWTQYKTKPHFSPYFRALVSANRKIRRNNLKSRRFAFQRVLPNQNLARKSNKVYKLLVFKFLLVISRINSSIEHELIMNSVFLPVLHALELESASNQVNEKLALQLVFKASNRVLNKNKKLESTKNVLTNATNSMNELIYKSKRCSIQTAFALVHAVYLRLQSTNLVQTESITANTLLQSVYSINAMRMYSESVGKACVLNFVNATQRFNQMHLNELNLMLAVIKKLETKQKRAEDVVNRTKRVNLLTHLTRKLSVAPVSSITPKLLTKLVRFDKQLSTNLAAQLNKPFGEAGMTLLTESREKVGLKYEKSRRISRYLTLQLVFTQKNKLQRLKFKDHTVLQYLFNPFTKIKRKRVKTKNLSEQLVGKLLNVKKREYKPILTEQSAAVFAIALTQSKHIKLKRPNLKNVVYEAMQETILEKRSEELISAQTRQTVHQRFTRAFLNKSLQHTFQLQSQRQKAQKIGKTQLSFQIYKRWLDKSGKSEPSARRTVSET